MKRIKAFVRGFQFVRKQQVVASSSSTSVNSNIHHSEVKEWDDIPGPPGIYNVPIIGAMLHFKPFTNVVPGKFHLLADELHDKYGPIVRVRLGRWRVMVEDVHDIETVFRSEGRYPNRPGIPVSIAYGQRRNVRNGLENLSGEDWETVRKPCSASLSRPNSALPYLTRQIEVAEDFADRITQRYFTPFDLNREFYKYTTEATGVITYNTRLGFLTDAEDKNKEKFLRANEELMEIVSLSIAGQTPFVNYFQTPAYKRYEKANDFLIRTVGKHIRIAREKMIKGNLDRHDSTFLYTLFNTNLSQIDIDTLLHNFVVAGTDSTAKTLQILFYNLAVNKDKQDRLYDEIKTILGPDGTITGEKLNKMPYLKACVKESFRLFYPTPTGTLRILPNDVVLSGYRVPKGTEIILSNQRLAKKPEIFERPHEYVPERWLRDSCGMRSMYIPSMAVLPFGFGPRNCVGRRFAEQELYLATIEVIKRCEIDLAEGGEVLDIEYKTFIHTKDPIPLLFKSRDSGSSSC